MAGVAAAFGEDLEDHRLDVDGAPRRSPRVGVSLSR